MVSVRVIFMYALCLVKHNITNERASLRASEFVTFDKTHQVNKNRTSEPTMKKFVYFIRTEIYSKKILSMTTSITQDKTTKETNSRQLTAFIAAT